MSAEQQLAVVTAQLQQMRRAFYLMCFVGVMSSVSLVLQYFGARQMRQESEASCAKREQAQEAAITKLEALAKDALSIAEDCAKAKSK